MMKSFDENSSHRPIRTFGRMHGRITSGQKRALARHAGKYLIPFEGQGIDFGNYFAREQDIVLDLGCGMCDALIESARLRPQLNFVGIDVYQPGIARGCILLEQAGIDNVRLIHHDMVPLLTNGIDPDSVKEIYVLFPDPWPKKRHQKRRLIQDAFVDLIRRALMPDAPCYLATDWHEYAEHIRAVFDKRDDFIVCDFTDDADMTLSKFNRRGQTQGRSIARLGYRAC